MNPKMIFLLSSISQPRCIKRIKGFIKEGFEIEIYGFDRGIYNVNSFIDGYQIHILGFAPSGKGYLKKFIFAKKVLSELFRKYKKENVIYYAFSFDIALICKYFSNKKYVYEISDLVYGYFNNSFIRAFFKFIDRRLVKTSLLTVMTSKGFNEYLFSGLNQFNVIVQPNKVDNSFYNIQRGNRKLNCEKIVFSYVGAFRYPNTVFRFARIIGEQFPQHEFHFYGDSDLTNQVKEMSSQYENVFYFGPFKSPEDLNEIYDKLDIIVACYETQNLNERIAEPNKLYEALFFKKPIIVSNGTFLAEQVKIFGNGFIIDATTDNSIIYLIKSLNKNNLETILNNVNLIQLPEIIDDNSYKITNFITSNFNNFKY